MRLFHQMLYMLGFTLILLLAACGGTAQQDEPTPELIEVTAEEGAGPAEEFFEGDEPAAEDGTDGSDTPPQPGDENYPAPPTAIPAADAVPYPEAEAGTYPEPGAGANAPSPDGRSLTALEAHDIALDVAQRQFDPEAQLYTIVPSTVMLNNLGGPPVAPGWFYKFKTDPDSLNEYVIQVVDDGTTGALEVSAISPLPELELPLDLDQIELDSDEVFAQFEEYAAAEGIPTEDVIYDLELVYLDNADEPFWSVVDPETLEWLYTISAVTGEETEYTR